MNKFSHKIINSEKTDVGVYFNFEKDILAKIEVLEKNVVRVIIKRKAEEMNNTYAISPYPLIMDVMGRKRDDLSGFSLPAFTCKDNVLCIDKYKIAVNADNFAIKVFEKNKMLYSDRETQSYNFYGELGNGAKHYIRLEKNEKNFGLGDKCGNVDKTGEEFRITCLDAMGFNAAKTDPLYKHIPFVITKTDNGYYGVFYDTHFDSYINLGKELDNYHGRYKYFSTEENSLCYYIILGSLSEIVKTFSYITGGSAFFPKWTLDYAGSTMAYTDEENSDRLLYDFLDKSKEKGISCRAFYLSSGYTSIGKDRCVFTWNRDKFKEPKEFGKKFLDNKVRVIANIKPCFLTSHPYYQMMAERGYFLKYSDETPALCQFWDGLGSLIDFTNPKAFDFWVEMVKRQLIDNNILFTWNDNNEYEVFDDDVYCDNFGKKKRAKEMKPVFSYLMQMASLKAQQSNGEKRQFMAVRSGGAGLSRYSQTWSGDNLTDYTTLRYNHKQAMGLSLSGVFNFGHDVGGFAGRKPERELFMRFIQNGIFTPRFCIHSWNDDKSASTPFMYEDIFDNVKKLFELRYSFLPYLYSAAYYSSMNFQPIISPLFYYFDDSEIDVESDEFMFDENVLVSNVFDEGVKNVKTYLPKNNGGWYKDKEHYEGGKTYEFYNDYLDLTLHFIKGGSVIARNVAPYDFEEKEYSIEFDIYPTYDGEFKSKYYFDDEKGKSFIVEFVGKAEKDIVSLMVNKQGNKKIDYKFNMIDCENRKLQVNFE